MKTSGAPDAREPARDADGGVRAGRPLVVGVDAVSVERGTCSACGAVWVGFQGRRTAPGQESWRVNLACPGCLAPGRVVLTLAAHSGVEVFLASAVPWSRRRWLPPSPALQAAMVVVAALLAALAVAGLRAR